ncbi:MAG: arsenic resistance N-acetyltransferase ArsN2 [Chloroflexaceae bacterium]|jgi:amino-acid N-acetyltransferase|nr:arsenic resistance N-acetyltransferase ArsN2 [Chloroflexaceae bacterium]
MQIRQAHPDELKAMLALLQQAGLPTAGLANHMATALVAHDDDQLIGCVALELYGRSALLRSLVVDDAWRGKAHGIRLIQAVLRLAANHHVERVYLLTETAEGLFGRFGFCPVARAEVDPAVQQSVEFVSACPASAQVMVFRLPG